MFKYKICVSSNDAKLNDSFNSMATAIAISGIEQFIDKVETPELPIMAIPYRVEIGIFDKEEYLYYLRFESNNGVFNITWENQIPKEHLDIIIKELKEL